MSLPKQPYLLICCLLIVCLLLLPRKLLWAQDKPPSSVSQLLKQLETAKSDTNKVNLLDEIFTSYRFKDTQKSLLYANQQLELAERLGWIKGQITAYNNIADAYYFLDLQKALSAIQKAYDLARENKLVNWQYRMLQYHGETKMQLKDYDQGTAEMKTSMEYFQLIKDIESWGYSARMMGLGYARQGKDSLALELFQQLLNKGLQEKDTTAISMAFSLLDFYYQTLKNDYQNALKNNLKRLTYFKRNDTSSIRAGTLMDIASDYIKLGAYVKALEYVRLTVALRPDDANLQTRAKVGMRAIYIALGDFNKVLELDLEKLKMEEKTSVFSPVARHLQIANDYIQLKQLDKALIQLNKAQELNKRFESQTVQANILYSLAYVYYLTNQYDSAYKTVNEALNIKEADVQGRSLGNYYLGMILRDASNEVLQKYGVSRSDRYALAVKNFQLALTVFKDRRRGLVTELQNCYKELSITYRMMNDYKGFFDTYPLYIALKDSSSNRVEENAFLGKLSEMAFEKKEDSLKFQQRLTEERLQQQTLLATQQEQSLQLNQQQLTILGNEKKLQELGLQTSRSDLRAEQNMRKANVQQLKVSQKEQALQKVEIKARRSQSLYLLSGLGALLIVSFFIARNYYNQRRSNRLLTAANTQISIEKQRSDNLLLNILPVDVAEELKEKGSAGARLYEEVTVLFTDFVNFTTISELLTPQELVDELHTCFKAFDDIIGNYGIEKIKTIGDAYLAVAGLPNADAQHASNTVNAALEIRQFIYNRKERMGNRSFDIRIGIHSGSVVAGIVGVKKFAYDIWGDTVNTAARMEQHSMPGQINLSEKTYELVKNQFAFTYRGEIEAKNKGALKMYFVEKQSASMASVLS